MLIKNKGFTLIEILLALAILSIIIAVTMNLFYQSASGIYSAGEKTNSLYNALGVIEGVIASPAGPFDQELSMVFPGEKTVVVGGKSIVVDYEYNGHWSAITYFLPE